MRTNQATAEIFFTAFKALKSAEKEAFFEKIVSHQRTREDLIDLALIEKAKQTKGKPISAKEYFAKRRKAGETS